MLLPELSERSHPAASGKVQCLAERFSNIKISCHSIFKVLYSLQ